ncbi:hypothetical protein N7452_002195 [Penicillium brevicompactum]|uniref:Uncharacterized protein n=1 Tax=Penicillium brevicompactum TaxID=5074 RepID=A0A9W9R3V1_PENBR|nr:hypothetical protein N7452_002195 [Penicillium brevicompactum]
MKASFVAALAALAGSAFAAPTNPIEGLAKTLKIGNLLEELHLDQLPVVSQIADLPKALAGSATSSAASAASSVPAVQNGHVVQNLGPQLDNILTVVGPDATTLLIELSPEVSALVSGLGLSALAAPLGSIVASASGLGGLVTGLGPVVDNLVTVVGADVGALLISLSAPVAGLVSGLGLPSVGTPVGTVVAVLGKNVKRGEIVQDVAPKVKSTLTVTAPHRAFSPVAALVSGLGLGSIAGPVGSIIAEASSVGDLLKDVSEPVENLLQITGTDGKHLLLKLSPSVVALVSGLGLPSVGTPVGAVVDTVANNVL